MTRHKCCDLNQHLHFCGFWTIPHRLCWIIGDVNHVSSTDHVSLSLTVHPGNTNSVFALDYISGSLTVSGQLDRENPLYSAGFTLTVKVSVWGDDSCFPLEDQEEAIKSMMRLAVILPLHVLQHSLSACSIQMHAAVMRWYFKLTPHLTRCSVGACSQMLHQCVSVQMWLFKSVSQSLFLW